jgi:hypothetical protein
VTLHKIADEIDTEVWDWPLFQQWVEIWPFEARVPSDPAMTGLAVIEPSSTPAGRVSH